VRAAARGRASRAPPDTSAASADILIAPTVEKNFTRAALEVTGVNVGIWLFCRYIREGGTNTGFRIGIQSWKDNLLNGFEWDDNQFSTNQFAHPYHGSMYFCSARGQRLRFLRVGAVRVRGQRDVGVLRRGAQRLDQRLGGDERRRHDVRRGAAPAVGECVRLACDGLGARVARSRWLLVNPMGGINRMFTGEMTEVAPPPRSGSTARSPRPCAPASASPASTRCRTPTLRARSSACVACTGIPRAASCASRSMRSASTSSSTRDDASFIGRAQVLGSCAAGEDRAQRRNTRTYFAVVNGFDYIDNWAYTFGGENLGACRCSTAGRRAIGG
jgi:hypothetical protein